MSEWPRSGDSLFANGLDWESEALLGVSLDSFLSYALAYKEAADAVIGSVQAKSVSPDAVGYPICFLYRHYVELMLKGLIKLGTRLEGGIGEYPRIHQIDQLWKQCRPLLERAFPEGEKADTDAVERCIVELASLDPSGEVFRYGEDQGGKPTLPNGVQLNLVNMRDVISSIGGLLEGSYDGMSELLQYQADIDSEYSE